MTTTRNAMAGLLAETSLHPGAGQATGIIDLPIQREAHTDWPCIFGSGVKGALRAAASARFGEHQSDLVELIFGPSPSAADSRASDHAGALLVSDARLLLLPVRSLTTHFKWVSCPAMLSRWQRDAQRLGIKLDFPIPDQPGEEQALISNQHNHPDDLFLEEYRVTPKPQDLTPLITALGRIMQRQDATAALHRQLTIVNDDLFRALAAYATPVNPHVRIEPETKTVATGALWFEESLPPDTLLYTCLIFNNARREQAEQSGQALFDGMRDNLLADGGYLQLGGNETTGMGWCILRLQTEAD
jgi:CRISPR-associated protein Cmr4